MMMLMTACFLVLQNPELIGEKVNTCIKRLKVKYNEGKNFSKEKKRYNIDLYIYRLENK